MKPVFVLFAFLAVNFLSIGCSAVPLPPPRPDAIPALLAHPEFPAVKAAAPAWARTALHTINDLQLDNAHLRSRIK